jgi:hypothetical protein
MNTHGVQKEAGRQAAAACAQTKTTSSSAAQPIALIQLLIENSISITKPFA